MTLTPGETEPEFKKADLVPRSMDYVCPHCGDCREVEALDEDSSGLFSVPLHARFTQCPKCEGFIDIGWNGWRWHDANDAREQQ